MTNQMDTPMLRDEYRQLRRSALDLTGGSAADFDREVRAVMARKALPSTPRGFVAAAELVAEAAWCEHQAELEYDYGYDTREEYDMVRKGY